MRQLSQERLRQLATEDDAKVTRREARRMAREINQLRDMKVNYHEGVADAVTIIRREAILNPEMCGVTTGLLNSITEKLIGKRESA